MDDGLPIPEEENEESEVVEYEASGSIPSLEDEWRGSPGIVVDKGLIAELSDC